jgi:ADP-heptose:LPS heptosyltransferase
MSMVDQRDYSCGGVTSGGHSSEAHHRSGRSALGLMRWVDHWVGLPLCFLLAVASAPIQWLRPRRRREVSGTGTIVVLKFFGLGSIMQASPLLRAIRGRYPQARLVFVTFEPNRSLLNRLGLCDEVRVIRTQAPLAFVKDTCGLILWFWRARVEAVLDLEFFSKFSTLLTFLTGSRIRVGFHLNDFWRYRLITHPVYLNYYRHISDAFRQVGQHLDVKVEDARLARPAHDPAARSSVEGFLKEHGWHPGLPLLGLNVNTGDMALERRWPLDRFAEVARTLLGQHPDLLIVLTGAPDEQPYVASLVERIPEDQRPRVIVAAGRWLLDEFLAALPLMTGFLTNDSGPAHLAAAMDVPMVSLWGPARPGFIAAYSPRHRILYMDYPCSPCILMFTTFEGMSCNHEGWCMQAIETSTVVEAVGQMLAAARAATSEQG